MRENDKNRTKRITLRLTAREYTRIEIKCKSSTCRKLSEYIRLVLFNKPVTVLERNQSLDELMEELIKIRTELNGIGNNFNQTVKKLYTLSQISEFRIWIQQQEQQKELLFGKIEQVKKMISKLADQWLQ